MRRLPALGLALLGLSTCAKERRPVALGDSAGYASATGGLLIDSIPILAVSSDEIGHIVGAVRLGDEVVIADGYSRSLVFFDLAGKQRRTVGRTGGGPGEFESIGWFGRYGADSLFTWDGGQARLSVFDAHGRFSREMPRPGGSAILSCSGSGLFAMLQDPGSMTHLPSDHDPRLFTRLKLFDSKGDSLWSLPNIDIGDMRPLGNIPRIAPRMGRSSSLSTATAGFLPRITRRAGTEGTVARLALLHCGRFAEEVLLPWNSCLPCFQPV